MSYYHLNHPTSMLLCPVLVQRWSTISRCWPSVAPAIMRKTRYATCTFTHLQQSLTAQSCNRTTALVQCRATAISSHYEQDVGPTLGQCLQLVLFIYINRLFFWLTSQINPSCQTDAVLITANKLKRDDSR